MHLAMVLWLTLLHAFSLDTASIAVRRDDVGARVAARQAHNPARWSGTTADVPVPDIRVPLRIPLRAAGADVGRTASPIPHGKGGSALPFDHRLLHSIPAPSLSQLRAHGAFETHRLESRGALLPYFPTAPPRRA